MSLSKTSLKLVIHSIGVFSRSLIKAKEIVIKILWDWNEIVEVWNLFHAYIHTRFHLIEGLFLFQLNQIVYLLISFYYLSSERQSIFHGRLILYVWRATSHFAFHNLLDRSYHNICLVLYYYLPYLIRKNLIHLVIYSYVIIYATQIAFNQLMMGIKWNNQSGVKK